MNTPQLVGGRMNFRRQLLDEWEAIEGEKPLGRIVCVFECDFSHNNFPEYFAALAYQAAYAQDGPGPWKVCWEWFQQAFEGDDKAMWEWFRAADNDELLAQFLAHVFDEDSAQIHAFLRSVVPEEEVRKFLEEDGQIIGEYDVYYEPLA